MWVVREYFRDKTRQLLFADLEDVPKRIGAVAIAVFAWIFFFPLTLIIPKKKKLVLVISIHGNFLDNVKYLFSYINIVETNNSDSFLLTTCKKTFKQLSTQTSQVIYYPSIKSIWMLIRASAIVAYGADWFFGGRYQLTAGAKRIMLWYGLPLKEIELRLFLRKLQSLPISLKTLRRIHKSLLGRYPCYDLLISTSPYFTRRSFSKDFYSRKIIEAGYPRNDILFHPASGSRPSAKFLLDANIDALGIKRVLDAKQSGLRILVDDRKLLL